MLKGQERTTLTESVLESVTALVLIQSTPICLSPTRRLTPKCVSEIGFVSLTVYCESLRRNGWGYIDYRDSTVWYNSTQCLLALPSLDTQFLTMTMTIYLNYILRLNGGGGAEVMIV